MLSRDVCLSNCSPILSEIVRQFMGGPADGPVPVHFSAADDIGQLVARQA
jgi:hypothetical protein